MNGLVSSIFLFLSIHQAFGCADELPCFPTKFEYPKFNNHFQLEPTPDLQRLIQQIRTAQVLDKATLLQLFSLSDNAERDDISIAYFKLLQAIRHQKTNQEEALGICISSMASVFPESNAQQNDALRFFAEYNTEDARVVDFLKELRDRFQYILQAVENGKAGNVRSQSRFKTFKKRPSKGWMWWQKRQLFSLLHHYYTWNMLQEIHMITTTFERDSRQAHLHTFEKPIAQAFKQLLRRR